MVNNIINSIFIFLNRIKYSVFSWGAWLIIPILMEIVPAIRGFFILKKRLSQHNKRNRELKFVPEITLIIPVYNSKDTLYTCIKSINDSTYKNEAIKVLLVDNKDSDEDFKEFQRAQKDFPELRMQWIKSKQGKSKAMNMALYNSEGKYIINVDSDGAFEPHALENMILKFEDDPTLNCMTGVILTEPDEIESYKKFFPRLLRKLEYMEYAQAFLAGRSYSADSNNIYTLSGAFSAFRRSTVLQSRMYNTDTICEDTQMTFQVKYIDNDRVEICEDAIYVVGAIEGLNKLYTQRQRWQRGSLEVGKMFFDKIKLTSVFKDTNVRTLLYDHTFAFPRIIWYIATMYFIAINFSAQILILTNVFAYIMYVLVGFSYFYTTQKFLKNIKRERKYYLKNWWCIFILPIFNFFIFFIRFAGVINSIGTDSSWKTTSFTDEIKSILSVIRKDLHLKTNEK